MSAPSGLGYVLPGACADGAASSDGSAAPDALLVTLAARGARGVLRLGGGGGRSVVLEELTLPELSLAAAPGVTLRPEWRAGALLPALHAKWCPAPWQLPAPLARGGAGATVLHASVGAPVGAHVSCVHRRAAPAFARAAHATRLTLRAGLAAASARPFLDGEAVYKLKLLAHGISLGGALGGARGAPAVAFAKGRHAGTGATLRVTCGLAAPVLGARLTLPDALIGGGGGGGGEGSETGEWVATLKWSDGAVRAATLTRRLQY